MDTDVLVIPKCKHIPSIITVAFLVLEKQTWVSGLMQIYKVSELLNISRGQIWILLSELSPLSASLYQVSPL